MVKVNSIKVPNEFVRLCANWHNGSGCILYAIASAGNLTLGSIRPFNYDEDRPMTDEEWYRDLFSDLEITLYRLMKGKEAANELYDFYCWVEKTIQRGFEDVENVSTDSCDHDGKTLHCTSCVDAVATKETKEGLMCDECFTMWVNGKFD